MAVAVDPKALHKVLRSEAGRNAILKLDIAGKGATNAILKSWQVDPIKENFLHADFYRIAMDVAIRVTVPCRREGRSARREGRRRNSRTGDARNRSGVLARRYSGTNRSRCDRPRNQRRTAHFGPSGDCEGQGARSAGSGCGARRFGKGRRSRTAAAAAAPVAKAKLLLLLQPSPKSSRRARRKKSRRQSKWISEFGFRISDLGKAEWKRVSKSAIRNSKSEISLAHCGARQSGRRIRRHVSQCRVSGSGANRTTSRTLAFRERAVRR